MTRTIRTETVPSTDPRLRSAINHDSKSREFSFDTSAIQVADVEHSIGIAVLDQGQVGSCTGHAGIALANTSPHVPMQYPIFQPDENGALALYSAAEEVDGDGPYPPRDNGSSGLSICKVLSDPNLKIIGSYQWTFTLQDALKALTVYPILAGMNWYRDGFTPDADGRVRITGALAGRHEVLGFRIDTENGRIWFRNSWGAGWGMNGNFYLTWEDFATLLAQGGDVKVPIPIGHAPAPVSAPATMNTATITRNNDNGIETLGTMTAQANGATFSCDTLELPWKDNATDVSCTPKGTYRCIATPLGTFHGQPFYELQEVPGRPGIFIHPGNYYTDILGCILLGVNPSDINHDGQIDVTSSAKTVASFMGFMGGEPFLLTIR